MSFTGYFFICSFVLTFLYIQPAFSQQLNDYDYRKADSLFAQEKWDDAASAYKYIAEKNTYNGYYWSNYAFCLYKQKNYTGAIENFKKAAEIGYEASGIYYNIACCYSLLNDPKEAIRWLEKAAEFKYTSLEEAVTNDEDFNPIRNNKEFKNKIIPTKDMFTSRESGWKTDLEFFKKRMEQTHYNIFGRVSKKDWETSIEDLSRKVKDLDNEQLAAGLYQLTAKVGDGHTTIFRPDNDKISIGLLPLTFFMFEDGLYILSASKEYGELAGKKVIKYGNTDASDILNVMRKVTPIDNEFGLKWRSMKLLTFAELMYGLGVTNRPGEAEITIEGGKTDTVKGVHLIEGNFPQEYDPAAWVIGRDTLNTPLYLKNTGNIYWYEYLPSEKIVYMQYNVVMQKKNEPLQAFVDSLFSFVNNNDVNYFILDLRFNSGGNSFLNKILVHGIIKCDKINQNGKFFTVIGRNTFSAAMNLTGDIERETNVIFAGEPTGSSPNFIGENNIITLPYSGIRVSCSSKYWQNYLSDDYRKWIAPQLGVKYYSDDYKNNIDPAMNEIINYIHRTQDQ